MSEAVAPAPERPPVSPVTRLTTLGLGVSAADVLLVMVTGGASFLGPVGPAGFVARLGVLAALVLGRRHLAARPLRRGPLVLLLLLLPTLLQFQVAGGRINGDGIMYYVYVRSLAKDADVHLLNEYTHYGLQDRSDLAVPTTTGYRRSIFAIGPAVAWLPFFAVGEVVARAQAMLGLPADLSGYGPTHRNAVALGSLLMGFGVFLLGEDLLRRRFAEGVALGAAVLLWGGSFLHWYMVQQPTMAHAPSAFGATVVLWLWLTRRDGRTAPGWVLLGLALGFAMCLRWQNGVLLVLPGMDLAARSWPSVRARRLETAVLRDVVACGALLAAGTLVGAFPQLLTWKLMFGAWLLPAPPHGADFLRLDHPWLLETLFSSRHGLLSWTPVLWLGYLGFVPLLRRDRALGLALLVPLLLMTYVNACSGDWWAGASYSNRRFDPLLPVFAFGLAASLELALRVLQRRTSLAVGTVVVALVGWNVLLASQVRRNMVPRDDTVELSRLAGNAWRVVAGGAGSPTTWPASWIFAARTGLPAAQYDLLVGRYLFYRQQNMGGRVDIGQPGDDAMLGGDWGPRETWNGVASRRLRGTARVLAPLDVPEDLTVRPLVCAPQPVEVVVSVNGVDVGRVVATTAWTGTSLQVPARFWRRELNDVRLTPRGDGVRVDAVDFGRRDGAWQER